MATVRAGMSTEATEASLGELVSTALKDFSSLVHNEIELAKTEVKSEVTTVAKGAAGFGIAAVGALFGGLFVSIALAFLIGVWLPLGWGFAIVGALYLGLAGLGVLIGMKSMKRVEPPPRTIRTIKDTAEWARHPTVAPDVRMDTLAGG